MKTLPVSRSDPLDRRSASLAQNARFDHNLATTNFHGNVSDEQTNSERAGPSADQRDEPFRPHKTVRSKSFVVVDLDENVVSRLGRMRHEHFADISPVRWSTQPASLLVSVSSDLPRDDSEIALHWKKSRIRS